MDQKQIADRAQFRRYAEAALAAVDHGEWDYHSTAELAFRQAITMMHLEDQAFEQYQLEALEAITADERNRHAEGS